MKFVLLSMLAFSLTPALAPLSTSCSLQLDALSPIYRKPEMFALSRTATASGIILSSTSLTLTSLKTTQVVVAIMICVAAATAGIAFASGHQARRRVR